jgi:hypothetical protein
MGTLSPIPKVLSSFETIKSYADHISKYINKLALCMMHVESKLSTQVQNCARLCDGRFSRVQALTKNFVFHFPKVYFAVLQYIFADIRF